MLTDIDAWICRPFVRSCSQSDTVHILAVDWTTPARRQCSKSSTVKTSTPSRQRWDSTSRLWSTRGKSALDFLRGVHVQHTDHVTDEVAAHVLPCTPSIAMSCKHCPFVITSSWCIFYFLLWLSLSRIQIQPEHLGRRRSEVPALLLAQLLRDDRRPHLGRGLCGQEETRRLQEGTAPVAARRGKLF